MTKGSPLPGAVTHSPLNCLTALNRSYPELLRFFGSPASEACEFPRFVFAFTADRVDEAT
jgi:hypothetical protein